MFTTQNLIDQNVALYGVYELDWVGTKRGVPDREPVRHRNSRGAFDIRAYEFYRRPTPAGLFNDGKIGGFTRTSALFELP